MIDYDKESAFQAGTRASIERDIEDSFGKGDMNQVDAKLDIHPYGREREPLGVVACYQLLKQKGSKAARFFEREATAEAREPNE